MPIDPSIAMGVRPLEVPNQLAQYGQLAQIQAAQRQNEMGQMQMDELRRDRVEMQKFQADLAAKGGNPDLNEYATMLLQSGNAAHQKMGIELKQKLMQQAQFEKIMGGGAPTAGPVAAPAPAQAGALGSGTYGALPAPTNALAPAPAAPANALAAPASNVAALRQKRDQLLAMGTQQSIAAANSINEDIKTASVQHVAAPGSNIWDASGKLIASTPERTDTDLIRNFNAAKTQGFTGNIFDYERQIKESGRTPAQPQPPVAVLDASGKPVYVTREEALKGRMTPAPTRGTPGLTPAQDEALYGENGAVTLGKLDPYKVNGRTAVILANAYIKNPNTDMNALASNAGLMRNAPYMARAQTTEMLPEILNNVVTAGKKVNYSDAKFIGAVEQFAKGQMNDPDFISYMTQRNDALLTIAGVMRGNGATDQAHRAEIEAASPTMSPAALDAWLKAQMTALAPRLKQAAKVTRTPGAAAAEGLPAPAAAGKWGKAEAEK